MVKSNTLGQLLCIASLYIYTYRLLQNLNIHSYERLVNTHNTHVHVKYIHRYNSCPIHFHNVYNHIDHFFQLL